MSTPADVDPTECAISAVSLEKSFGSVRAVTGLSFSVRPGETVALLGPNGAGKTTTISLVLGLLRPDGGTVRVLGREPDEAVRAGLVGATLQDGGLLPACMWASCWPCWPVSIRRR